jgi:hypothetical protein
MIIYNETFVVEEAAEQQWLQYMEQEHIPAVMATGYFSSHHILTVIDSPNEGVTYCIQYFTDDVEKYYAFNDQHLQALHIKHNEQFENRFVLFNSLMKTLN